MATEHRNLTGASLHEPKGAYAASSGQVYISDGAGSGNWTDKNSDNLVFNTFTLQDRIADVGTSGSSAFFYIPFKATIQKLSCIIHGALTGANSTLSIYVNGVARAETLVLSYSGSSAGQAFSQGTFAAHTIPADSVVEIRSDGGATNTISATTSLRLIAVV